MVKKIIYLDNNATTKVDEEVLGAMVPFFCNEYGNPSSIHSFGGDVKNDVEKARHQIADLIGANSSEIIFTSCGTESDNAAILSCLQINKKKKHVVTTKVEHPAVLQLCKVLEERGFEVSYLAVDKDGQIDLDELKKVVREDTAVVSIMAANNETGIVFPIEEAAKIAKAKGSYFHCDAVQGVGKMPFDMSKSNIDLLSFSGHKIHAPKGIGILYVKKGVKFSPFLIGGHQESGLRAGTENVPYIVGLGKAALLAKENLGLYNKGKIQQLRDKLEKGIVEKISDVLINGKNTGRVGNTLSVSFKFIEGESILLLLDELGICASSGSACTSGSLEPSHVLRAMGISHMFAHGTIRFSLSRFTKQEDIDFVLEHLPKIIDRLRKISPFS